MNGDLDLDTLKRRAKRLFLWNIKEESQFCLSNAREAWNWLSVMTGQEGGS